MTELTFDNAAESWLEALPLGNGRLGAMCYGGTDVVRFDINDETAWSGSPASEASQPSPDAHTATELLEQARQLIADGRPADAEAPLKAMQSDYSQSYLPFATVTLRLGDRRASRGDVSGYRRSLDLATATHEVQYRAAGLAHTQRTFVSVRHGVLVHIIEGAPADLEVDVEITSPLRLIDESGIARGTVGARLGDIGSNTQVALLRLPSDAAPTHAPQFAATTWSDNAGASVEGALVTRVVREVGTDGLARWVVFVATETTFGGLGLPLSGTADDAAGRALARIDAAVAVGTDAIAAQHRRDHAELFSRVRLRFQSPDTAPGVLAQTTAQRLGHAFADPQHPLADDPGLAGVLFDYGRYLLLSSSRPGSLPATLQGIWNDSMQPPWSSNYTLNINLQMNYWQANLVNLPEAAEPLIDFIVALAAAGEQTATRLYSARGWAAHHNSDAWLYTAMAGGRTGDTAWSFWPMAGPWLIRHLWDGVEFGMIDEADVRDRLWPVIRGAAEFGLDWLIRMPVGSEGSTWGTAPSTSPENTFVTDDGRSTGVDRSTAMDLSLLSELFQITVAAAELIGVGDDAVADEARRRLAELPDAPGIGRDGRVIEWSGEFDETDEHHRHVSPLYFVYPGRGIYDGAHRNAAERTLEKRGDASTGWSLVWKLALWARLGRRDKVSDLLRLVFQPASAERGPFAGGLYPNLFAAHPPFQIDGNLGFVAALAEALLQSHAGIIDLLPALPAELGTGEVSGLIARPGVVVDIRWREGALIDATLRARDERSTGTHRVRSGGRTIERSIRADAPTRVCASDFAMAVE
jgi:alpha-L-fucosidase 2